MPKPKKLTKEEKKELIRQSHWAKERIRRAKEKKKKGGN